MQPESKYSWLTGAIDDGAVVVTASRRLARELRHFYNQSQLDAGRKSWPTANIHSWHGWLALVFDTAESNGLRLQSHAALVLWEHCLLSVMPERMQNFSGLVRQCHETWNRVAEWDLSIENISKHARYGDERLFARAAEKYQGQLSSKGWTDPAGLASAVEKLISGDSVSTPAKLVLAGFDRFVPTAERLIEALRQKGCDVDVVPDGSTSCNPQLSSYPQSDAELRAAGAWARSEINAHPGQCVAIVCTELERSAQRAGRLIREGFAPGWQYGGIEHQSAVNVSYGQRLSDYPAIAVALAYLGWTCRGLPSRDISLLLRSRGSGNPQIPGRCRLELRLRQLPDRSWTPAGVASALGGIDESSDAVEWLQGVRQVAQFRQSQTGPAGPAEWAQRFDQLLQLVDWPGSRTLDSAEFQLVNRWRNLLNEFAATELIAPQIRLATAVRRITSMASDVVFQPERRGGSVQVLGALEAAGLEFDAVWITGLDSSRWPPHSNPLPLVSRQLQREFLMPDFSPNDTLEFSRRVLGRLTASAPSVVISWARSNQDSEQTSSQLLESICEMSSNEVDDPGWHAATFAAANNCVVESSDPAPHVGADETVQGGAYTVQRQHTEPFSAFAFGRLGISDIHAFETGIPARTRGTIVHRALHELYAGHPDLQEINGWSDADLKSRIEDAATAAVSRSARHVDATHQRLFALERARLQQLLHEFVAAERDRPAFRVDALEADLQIEHGGVILNLKLDRADRLQDGTWLVADYKTGATKSLTNRRDEPNDLQLTVYSCAWKGEIGGMALINVDLKSIKYNGTGASTHWHKDKDADWVKRLDGWQQLVHAAMQGIAQGDIRINVSLASDKTRALALLSRIEEIKREL